MAQDDLKPALLYDPLTDPYNICNHQEDPLAPEQPTPLKITCNRRIKSFLP